MGMHLRTGMFSARNEATWGRLLYSPQVEFTVTHNPLAMSAYGRKTLRRWMRAGYCDKPGGEAAKRWELLMLTNRARHITYSDRTGWLGIRVMQKFGIDPWVPDIEKINAFLALWRASENVYDFKPTVGLVTESAREQWVVDKSFFSSVRIRPAGYTSTLSLQNTGVRAILNTLVRELGHPLANLGAALDSIDLPCTFRVVTKVCDCDLSTARDHAIHTNYYTVG